MSTIFQDSMDRSRTIVPLRYLGRQVECKVFFEGRYFGKTLVPDHMLHNRPENDEALSPGRKQQLRTGFVATPRDL